MADTPSMTPPKDRKTPVVKQPKLTPEDVADAVLLKMGDMEVRFNKRFDDFEHSASEALIGAGKMLEEAIGIMRDALNHAIAVNQKAEAAVAALTGRVDGIEARVKVLEGKVG